MASYRTALEIDPDFAMAYFNLGNVLFRAGRPGEAVPLYDRALELRPGYEKAREYRERALEAAAAGGARER